MADEPAAPDQPDEGGDAAPPDAPETEDAATTLSTESAALWAELEAALGGDVVEHAASFGDLVVRVRPAAWRRAAEVARDELDCDYLSFVSGIDWLPRPAEEGAEEAGGDTSSPVQPTETTYGVAGSEGRFQGIARVASTRHPGRGVTLKVDVDEHDPHLESWVEVYPGADWHERECWEMYGFVFDGHPALRHLYLPSAFEGHPLRKDFPLLAREVKPWPGLVDVEDMPPEPEEAQEAEPPASDTPGASTGEAEPTQGTSEPPASDTPGASTGEAEPTQGTEPEAAASEASEPSGDEPEATQGTEPEPPASDTPGASTGEAEPTQGTAEPTGEEGAS